MLDRTLDAAPAPGMPWCPGAVAELPGSTPRRTERLPAPAPWRCWSRLAASIVTPRMQTQRRFAGARWLEALTVKAGHDHFSERTPNRFSTRIDKAEPRMHG